jgi:hypothetical protein
MTISKPSVADNIAAYLHHEITLAQLADWSERALMDGEIVQRVAASPRTAENSGSPARQSGDIPQPGEWRFPARAEKRVTNTTNSDKKRHRRLTG